MAAATLRLVLITDSAPAPVSLPDRTAELDRARERAIERALTADVVADLREAVAGLLARLAKHPGDLQGLLFDLGRKMYVSGRMDQQADDDLARNQTAALLNTTLARVVQLAEHRTGGA
jgi:hypothetical protein